MDLKFFYIFAILYARSSSLKYENISDCVFYNKGFEYGDDGITIICDKDPVQIFSNYEFKCSNYNLRVKSLWPGTMDFRNCRFNAFKTKFFDDFKYLQTLAIPDLELKTLEVKTFMELKNLTKIDVSRNCLTEIPPMIFINALKLQYVDFSKNSIEKISPFAFTGATSLETLDISQNLITGFDEQSFKDQTNVKMLNLSHNHIESLDLRNLTVSKLLSLDLSNNWITMLAEHIFDEFTELRTLNLSFNAISDLRIETFAFLSKMEHLNLRRTNLSSILLGTFSHQHKLISLDLSQNSLKELDFNLFLPGLSDLRSLYLAENQLTDLVDFQNSLFPQLNEFDIKNNRFNCSYLQQFMKSINWSHISLLIDPRSVNPQDTNIRGIKCEIIREESMTTSSSENTNKKFTGNIHLMKSNQQSNGDVCLILCIIVTSAFLVIFLYSNREKIFNRSNVVIHLERVRQSMQNRIVQVQYSNDGDLLH